MVTTNPEPVTHDAYCCMNGIAPSAGPLPGCPGIDALNERYAEAKFENDCAADLGPEA